MIKLDAVGFLQADRELMRLSKRAGYEASEFVDVAAKEAVKAVIRKTQPFGLTGKAKKEGEGAIRSDMHNTFKVVSNQAAGQRNVITTRGEALAALRRMRNSKRRVDKGGRKTRVIHRIYTQLLSEKIPKVGEAKGAWSSVAMKLGVPTQKWISRHSRGGSGHKGKNLSGAFWDVNGEVDHLSLDNVFGERGLRVLTKLEPTLKRHFIGKIRRAAQLAERKVNG